MLEYADYKTLTGYAVEDKTEAQLVEAIGRKINQETTAAIATALLAYYLIEVRNYKVAEAADALDVTSGYMSLAASRGRVLHLASTPTTAHTVWAQVRALSAKETQDMCATLTAKTDGQRAEHLRDHVTRQEVAKRLGDNATPEKVDAIAEAITSAGTVTPKAIRKAIPAVAEAHEVALPEPSKRSGSTDNANNEKAAKAPSLAEALSQVERWNLDRTEGSDEERPYAMTEDERGTALAIIGAVFGILARAGEVEAIIEGNATAATALDMVTEPASA